MGAVTRARGGDHVKCVVTGAAGFIGSHLCASLLKQGHDVVGLDAFVPYYDRSIKERNLVGLRGAASFRFLERDLRKDDLLPIVADAEVVFHVAAMAGLLWSWSHFDWYDGCNVLGTQRLLDALRLARGPLKRLINASTSSVYGKVAAGDEDAPTQPISPYGVTKLAAEHLCRAYGDAYGLPCVTLRYFSVYGPGQRPDMGYFKFIDAGLRGETVTVFGDGQQSRGNTYVDDCVAATIAAADAAPGTTYNVGGGEPANVWQVLALIEELLGQKIATRTAPARPGDQSVTLANVGRIARDLGWRAQTSLRDGLAKQVAWQRSMRG
jgi:nucleoside-diphosphate-sugar epimerase